MKKNYLLSLVMILTALAVFSACDIIDEPYQENPNGGPDTTTTVMRKVLIEEFTGVHCGNCPNGAIYAHQIEEAYADKAISIGVHSGSFAIPSAGEQDFRTEVGTALYDYYGVASLGTPNGLVNRTPNSNIMVLPPASWATAAVTQLAVPAEVKIELTPDYDETTRTITLTTDITYLQNQGSDANKLTVYIVEDEIIAPQTWYGHDPGKVEDYEHNNVLRASMNGTWGEVISQAGAVKGDKKSKELTYKIPENWKAENIKLVAFVSNDDENNSILNVEWCELEVETTTPTGKNMIVINHADDDVVNQLVLMSGEEIVWEVNLENTATIDEKVHIGYKVNSLFSGHTIGMCAGVCLPATTTDFEAKNPMTMKPNEITGTGMVSLHLYSGGIVGSSEIEFYYYTETCPTDTVKRTITFNAK